MSKSNQTIGLVLVLVGIYGILNYFFHFDLFSMSRLWPIFLLIPGLGFEIGYFSSKKAPGVLVPGGILLTLGCVFLFQTYTNWHFAGYTWPLYVLAPAIGLLQLYIFGNRSSGLLIPITVLFLVVIFGLLSEFGALVRSTLIWPIAVIVIGVLLLFGKGEEKDKSL